MSAAANAKGICRPAVLATVLGLLSVVRAGGPAAAQTSAQPPSAEEAVLALLPYRLTPADLPQGFSIQDTATDTPSSEAVQGSQSSDDAAATLHDLQSAGFVVDVRQTIMPNLDTPLVVYSFEVDLYTSARLASAALSDDLAPPRGTGIAADNPPMSERLGDESGALHVTVVRQNSDNAEFEQIVWRRGRLVFQALLQTFDATESLDQALPLAEAADRHAAAQTPPPANPTRTLPAAGDEATRLQAILALVRRLPAGSDAPLGCLNAGTVLINNADLVAEADDPQAAYNRLANEWHRVVAVERQYLTAQGNDGDQINVQYALSADAAGSAAYLADPELPAGSSVQAYALQAALGDAGRLYDVRYTAADGVPHEAWLAVWTHATVALSVSGDGPQGEFSAAQVSAFAGRVDARYEQGGVPNILTTPITPSTPAPLPPPIS
jgi:hypothetical protein